MPPEQTRRERFTAYAETLDQRFKEGILGNLQDKPLWVLYKLEKDSEGSIHKRPYTPKDYPASIYKPRQWATLANVLEALATGNFHVAGIGIMLPAPLILIDKDAREDAPMYDKEAKKIVSPLALKMSSTCYNKHSNKERYWCGNLWLNHPVPDSARAPSSARRGRKRRCGSWAKPWSRTAGGGGGVEASFTS